MDTQDKIEIAVAEQKAEVKKLPLSPVLGSDEDMRVAIQVLTNEVNDALERIKLLELKK